MGIANPLRIVRCAEPLSEDFLPERLFGREALVGSIWDEVSRIRRGERPRVVWLHGPPGAGKTSLVRRVLGSLEEQKVRTAYVNGWSAQTFYAILDTVLDELRALVGEAREVSFKFEQLSRLAKRNPLVIALDEVDQMFLRERNATLYNLARLGNVGLICLGQSREAYLGLDPRVQSRLQPVFVSVTRYSTPELIRILEVRATQSLEPEAWCRENLERIAKAASGDARIAVQGLRTAAYIAEKGRTPNIRSGDIRQGIERSAMLRRAYLLKGLSDHHRLLFQIVHKAGEITLPELWRAYQRQARDQGLIQMARRTFNNYRQSMIMNRLLVEKQARGRRNQRVVRVALAEHTGGGPDGLG